jgi:ketosteroid isomerase-like protein
MRTRRVATTSILAVMLTAAAHAQAPADAPDGRAADRAAIRAHIEGICQAFLDGDVEKIHATHTEDWRGFLENSRAPIKGIDAYMRANGIPWPPVPGAPKRGSNPNANTFRLSEFDAHFYGPDTAVANFFVDFGRLADGAFTTSARYRIMDIYVRRNGQWNQAASHTVIDPTWRAEQIARPATLPPPVREQLLAAREAVWRAFFTNDQAQLARLVPPETIVLEGPLDRPFARQADILEAARQAAARRQTLVRLEFPLTEIQVYGTTAIIYTTYLYELENPQGQRETTTGRATEIFVRRDGAWVNPGWHMTPVK